MSGSIISAKITMAFYWFRSLKCQLDFDANIKMTFLMFRKTNKLDCGENDDYQFRLGVGLRLTFSDE